MAVSIKKNIYIAEKVTFMDRFGMLKMTNAQLVGI